MTPSVALRDPAFIRFTVIVTAVLFITGVVLALLTYAAKKNVSKVWTIWRSWLVMVPTIVLFVFLGRYAVIAGVALLAILGFREFARATGLAGDYAMTGAVYLAIIAVSIITAIPHLPRRFALFNALPIYAVCLILLVPILRNRTQGQLQAIAVAIVGFLYTGWMFQHLSWLANSIHPYGLLAYLVFAVEINDVAAYTFGKLFGRHSLRSNISPKKTWEGALGALAVSMALPWALPFAFPPAFDATAKILTGLIVGVGGQLGDLSISVLKRDIGVKDMGAAIPGHGGILDRIDSLIFTAPLFVRLVNLYYPFV